MTPAGEPEWAALRAKLLAKAGATEDARPPAPELVMVREARALVARAARDSLRHRDDLFVILTALDDLLAIAGVSPNGR